MKIWRMRIACWIHKATNITSEYVIPVVCQLQQWLHEHTSVLRFTYVACLLSFERWHINCSLFTCSLGLLKKNQLFVYNFLPMETFCVLCEVGMEYLYLKYSKGSLRPCRDSGGYSSISHRRGTGLIPAGTYDV